MRGVFVATRVPGNEQPPVRKPDCLIPRGIRILVAGGHDVRDGQTGRAAEQLQKAGRVRAFCKALGRALAEDRGEIPVVIITGGRGGEHASDLAIVEGAQEVLGDRAKSRIVTFDSPTRPPEPGFENTLRCKPRGASRQARRFEMVRNADAVLSIAGVSGSPEAISFARALDTPALPLLFTGGKSAEMSRDAKDFGLDGRRIESWSRLAAQPDADLTPLAGDVTEVVLERAVIRCFVAMPYGEPTIDALYEKSIKPAIADAGCRAIRPVDDKRPGQIVPQMLEDIRQAGLLVAWLSDDRYPHYPRLERRGSKSKPAPGVNPNVMLEVGFASALGIPTVLLANDVDALPFDIRPYRKIKTSQPPDGLQEAVRTTLRALRQRG